ncbi:AraC family transcriptional regulator [Anoxynatronum buryatiense]|uniref:AraC family transcriptional regulator n=1 Tax=Anoxynatronum buryatiense TaxID=489973 RepID=A0AA46AI59_9CLOT|nr:AraC family transcriptional regulator [Anoxynatronum buryatiense]SMP45598.1 AraC family transcriptional regulator [Anoxynatronum buryatiense]
MHAWEQIQKTVDYIEDELSEEIQIETLAHMAGLSRFYFQRLFKRLVKRPVNEYIKLRRLARASAALTDTDRRIVDVAMDFGFSSHETFTRAFKEAYGITPEEYRAVPVRLNQIYKPELLLNYTMIDEDVPLITNSIVIEITRKKVDTAQIYAGLSAQVPISQAPVGEATGIDIPGQLWDAFHRQKVDMPHIVQDSAEIGVSMMGETENETFTYFVGGASKSNTADDGHMTTWQLAAGEYVVCCFEAENVETLTTQALGKAISYLFGTWLAKRGLVTHSFSMEKYGKPMPDGAYMELWVMPVHLKDMEKPPSEVAS